MAYYARGLEDDRLTGTAHGRLEFIRTQELVRRLLPPPPARVLDVGGATGVHAKWLAADGYQVHLIDLVAAHVDAARRLGGFTAAVGDARALPEPDASAAAVLLLGPMYHLVERDDRLTALAEARRVVRPGGPVVAAAISRYAALIALSGRGRLDEVTAARIEPALRDGAHDARVSFMRTHLHAADELAAEFTDAGLRDVTVYAVEGPMAAVVEARAGTGIAEQVFASALTCARMVERNRDLLAASTHLLAVGRA